MLRLGLSYRHTVDVRSGFRSWNVFVPTEQQFLLLSFLKANRYQILGFLQMFMMIEGSLVIVKVGQVIFIDWNGYVDTLSRSLEKKQMEKLDFLSTTDMKVI